VVGPQLYGVGLFIVNFLWGVLTNFTLSNDIVAGHLVLRLFVLLVAELAMTVLIVLVYLGNERLGKPISNRWFLLVFLFAGAVRGVVLSYLLVQSGLSNGVNYGYRIYAGATSIGLAVWFWSLLFGLVREWKSQGRRLSAESAYLKLKQASTAEKTREQLLTMINDVIRPSVEQMLLSRTAVVAEPATSEDSSIRFANIWQGVSAVGSIKPVIQTWPALFSATAAAFVIYGIANGFIVLSSFGVIWAFILWVLKLWVAPHIDRLGYRARIAALVVLFPISVLPTAIIAAITPHYGSGSQVPLLIIVFSLTTGLGLVFWDSFIRELGRVGTLRQATLRQIKWKVAEVNSRAWHQQLHFARRVHGALQSEVAAMAIRLGRDLAKTNLKQLDDLGVLLEQRVKAIFEAPDAATDLASVLTEIAETWQGISQITVHLTDGDATEITRDQIAVETVLELVREGISNAIRHGGAKVIDVRVEIVGDDLVRVSVANDGVPVAAGPGRQGMGSRHLQECTVEYSIGTTQAGTLLLADVPFRG
jgi:signal transduction histidine kinase